MGGVLFCYRWPWVGVEVAGAVWPRDPRSTKTRVGSVSDPPRSTGALLGDFDLVLAAFRRSPDPRGAAVTPHPHVEGAADWSSVVVVVVVVVYFRCCCFCCACEQWKEGCGWVPASTQ